jgi:hypothetical protein
MVPDRTRRDLSIGHITFFRRPLLHDENCKILSKYSHKTARSRADSFLRWFQQNQTWFQIDLDELYRLRWLFFSIDPSFMVKTPNYCEKHRKSLNFEQNLSGFVPKVVITKPMVVPDRTRRDLSIGHVAFFNRPSLHDENCKILSKYRPKTTRSRADLFLRWFQQNQWWFQIELDEIYRLDTLLFFNRPPFMMKIAKYCLNTVQKLLEVVPICF